MERKLPIIEIEGTAFIVDVIKEELIEKDRPGNTLDIKKMTSMGFDKGYSFNYNVKLKSYRKELSVLNPDIKEVHIEDFCRIDPYGMAQKYNIPVENVKKSNDLELAIKHNSLVDRRWNGGVLPTLTIAEQLFYVDIGMRKLRPKDDFQSKGIDLRGIEKYHYVPSTFTTSYKDG